MQSSSSITPSKSFLSWVYFDFLLLGVAVPMYFFGKHFLAHGFSLPLLLEQAFVNPVATALTSDLLISSFVFWLFAGMQLQAKGQLHRLVIFIALNLGIGLSCALPAYLWWSRRQHQ